MYSLSEGDLKALQQVDYILATDGEISYYNGETQSVYGCDIFYSYLR